MGVTGKIYGINGPIVTIRGNLGFKMNEMVYVGQMRLVGVGHRTDQGNDDGTGI